MPVAIDTVEGEVEGPQRSSGDRQERTEPQEKLDPSKLRALMTQTMRRKARVEAD
jgi:hypothetical protein